MNHFYITQSVKVKVHLNPEDLTQNYETTIKKRVMTEYGNKCYLNGYIDQNSIEILKIANGTKEGSHLHGFLTFHVEFSARFCVPKRDTIIPCRVQKINKFGVMAYVFPIDVRIPKQLQSYDKSGSAQGLEKMKGLKEGDLIYVKTLDYTIEENRLTVVGLITDVGLEKPNTGVLPTDGLIAGDYQVVLQFSPQIPPSGDRFGSNDELNQRKEQINPYEGDEWNFIKTQLNDYELLRNYQPKDHLIQYSDPNAQIYDPKKVYPIITRAYFKLWEILSDTKVLDQYKGQPIKIANLAEGPGGFIQCLLDYRNRQHEAEWKQDQYYAITIKQDITREELKRVQDWEWKGAVAYFKKVKAENYQVIRSYGSTGDGNMINLENIENFSQLVGDQKCQLITGDGGISLEIEQYKTQEYDNMKLFFAEILTALRNQAQGGVFILKIYDIYYEMTFQMIELLTYYYAQVRLIKPHTSRPANSEKYLVCTGFRGITTENIQLLTELFDTWIKSNQFASHLLSFYENPESSLISEIKAFNQYNNELQTIKINEGLDLATQIRFHNPQYKADVIKRQSEKQRLIAAKWCQQYGIPYYK